MDKRPLKVKALECAIKNIKLSITPAMANKAYKTWEVFHDNQVFKQAVKEKQTYFKTKKNEKRII